MFAQHESVIGLVVEVSLKAMLLAIAVGAGLWIFRVRNCNLRHRAWTAVLAAMLLLPALVHVAPHVALPDAMVPVLQVRTDRDASWDASDVSYLMAATATDRTHESGQTDDESAALNGQAPPSISPSQTQSPNESPATPASVSESAVSTAASSTAATPDRTLSWPAFFLILYVLGAAVFGGRLLGAVVRLRRLVPHGHSRYRQNSRNSHNASTSASRRPCSCRSRPAAGGRPSCSPPTGVRGMNRC